MTARPDRPRGTRAVVRARGGMVAAAHPLAAEAGVRVLRDGGSAVDAGIAANAVLAVVEPVSCGLGGDLFALLWNPRAGRLEALDASGRAPLAADPARVVPEADGTISLRSPESWTVPGAVDGWCTLHERHGRLPFGRLLEDAIRLAREGFPVSEVIASAWSRGALVHAAQPGFAETFLPGGRAPAEGEVFRNEALAEMLQLLGRDGRAAFYEGRAAEAIVEFSRLHGGVFAREDFLRTRATWVEPLSTSFDGHELWELPPPGQGLAALALLQVARLAGISRWTRDDADWWHVLVEAKKLAFEDRARWFADPGFTSVPVGELLSEGRARRQAGRIDPERAAQRVEPEALADRSETTYLATADASGSLLSLIQSNYTGFGSGHVVAELGFGLQNRGALFALDERHPNRLEPGKRPFHTIIPAFVTRGGAPWLAFGVMGGDMQPQGHVQVLLNLVSHGMNLQEAGDAPRFHHGGSSEPTGVGAADGGIVHLEPEVPDGVREELLRRGHRVGDQPFAYGGYQAVARDAATGCFEGATERRKDGCALGF